MQLRTLPTAQIIAGVRDRATDLGLIYEPASPVEEDIATETVGSFRVACVLPRAHPLAAKESIRPEDLAGLPIPEAEWPQQRAARGERFRMEFAVSDADGSRRWFEAVTEPLTSQDRTWGGVVAIRDVSERTMRLSLERLMAAAGHELKTPTAAIHNYLQLVDRHLAQGEVKEAGTYAARALSQTRRLSTLIERLLDVGRIQSGQLELMFDVVDLTAVVRDEHALVAGDDGAEAHDSISAVIASTSSLERNGSPRTRL